MSTHRLLPMHKHLFSDRFVRYASVSRFRGLGICFNLLFSGLFSGESRTKKVLGTRLPLFHSGACLSVPSVIFLRFAQVSFLHTRSINSNVYASSLISKVKALG